jgi:NAD(P)-dependent dehydrogenase (short-subunit alcohol dehydrogenase family)
MSNIKTILITGCSSGIGLECARFLKKDGFRVFASARQDDDVKMLKNEGFEAYKLDITNDEHITQVLQDITSKTGGTLDALFNNAAFGQPGAIEDLSKEVLKQQFETNVFGTHELTSQTMKIMRKQGYGRIVQNSSVLGIVSLRYRGAYNASKYALEGLSDTLRLEVKDSNIFISLIEPGPITSKFRQNALKKFEENIDVNSSFHKTFYEQNVLPRLHSKEEKKEPFTLGSDAVYKKLHHALTNNNPKPRYYVTFPTYLLGYLKRLLSTRVLDFILYKV